MWHGRVSVEVIQWNSVMEVKHVVPVSQEVSKVRRQRTGKEERKGKDS